MLRSLVDRLNAGQKRFVKFCLVGASGVGVNLFVMFVTSRYLFSPLELLGVTMDTRIYAGSALGIVVSIFTNFLLNDRWTWGDRRETSGDGVKVRLVRFYVVCGVGGSLQYGTFVALYRWAGLHDMIAQFLGIALATLLNYGINNMWTFRSPPAND